MKAHEQNRVFTEIYETTYNDVFRYVVSKCQNSSDIHDLIQNTYLHLYCRLGKINGEGIKEPRKYLIRIARNEVFKQYGFWGQRKNLIPVYSQQEEEDFSHMELGFLFEEGSISKLLCDEIWAYLKAQDLLTFKIFALYFVSDLKITEIASQLKVNESMVKNRLYRNMKQLKEKFSM